MLLSSKFWASLPIFILLPFLGYSQPCKHVLQGILVDAKNGETIYAASILLEEQERGILSDSTGFFRLDSLCDDHFHVHIERLGYESKKLFIEHIGPDSVLRISLTPTGLTLDGVLITENAFNSTQQAQAINQQRISDNANMGLSKILEAVTGVNSIKSGGAISKPVVHGLYGNRLTILNNGVAQSGQQWGNDHSPEIDPLAAQKISVIKGTSSLAYQGSSLGSVVLIEPNRIKKNIKLQGKVNYFFETNGRGHGLNAQLQHSSERLSWRVVGTLKKKGDQNTPDYFLNNTGSEEANIAIQLEKSFSEKWQNSLYFSSFNTKIGVLRGSHIGNLTDLETALSRDEPFFTEETFSYEIDAPYQQVNHHLLKLQSKYFLNNNAWLDFTYGGQLNLRKEFDVRRSGLSNVPALDLYQLSNFVEAKYNRDFKNDWQLKTGLQFNFINNKNEAGTGILPLIPNYTSIENGAFVLMNKQFERLFWEFGARYDYINQRVAAISETLPREILNYNNHFHTVNISSGLKYTFLPEFELAYNIGLATRNPAVNELYSNGLHQGVSGIEEGDVNLNSEKSIKTTLGMTAQPTPKWRLESLFYYQNINDYIFLNPQNEVRLTIRGAFPVFKYEQTNAQIYGFDFRSDYTFSEQFKANVQYSFIQGDDLTNGLPLINMPSNNLSASFSYKILEIGRFKNLEITVSDKYVFEQSHLLAFQDFVLPPDAYNLIGVKISTDITVGNSLGTIYISADNLLNVAYRDYLNRLRYFADDLGRNIVLGVSCNF